MIAGRWAVLARWSDRLDVRALQDAAGGPDVLMGAEDRALLAWGAGPGLARAWRAAEPLGTPPWACLGDPHYPSPLLDLSRPPPALWLRGRADAIDRPMMAVVGSRACTPYGRRVARSLGRAIAVAGGVLVSGGARGIDTEAHLGAAEQGPSVAVLGAGLSAPSGAAARRTLDRLVETGGAVLSEMPPADPPTRWTFPRRNRLIAALGVATVVVEAGERSGARITARLATELGRDVYAVPGPLGAPASAGCLQLIADGAIVVQGLGAIARRVQADNAKGPVSGPLAALLALLEGPVTVGELAAGSSRSVPDTLQSLVLLELGGAVRRLPGGRYQRA